MLKLILLVFTCVPSMAFATVSLDGNVFYYSDSYVSSTNSSYSRLLYDAALSLSLTSKGRLFLGWDYNAASFTDTANSSTTKVSVSGMGPKLTYYFDKDYKWSLSFTYDIVLNGTNTTAGTSDQLQGTAMKIEAGYSPEIYDGINLGLKLNYYKASVSDTITNSTTLTKVSYSRSDIYPSIAFIIRFN